MTNALGSFLRSRREAASPAAAGLPVTGRRRTPGLRRAELAELAGVSVEYLTRLERGRDRRPSGQVVAALAEALRLDEDEHVHLIRLVKAGDTTTGPADGACAAAQPVRASALALLQHLDAAPAVLVDRPGSVLARTTGWRELTGWSGAADAPNLARFVFTAGTAPRLFPDWAAVADEWAVRVVAGADLGDPRCARLHRELLEVPAFAERADRPRRVPRWTGRDHLLGPDGRVHDLAYEAVELPGTDEHRLLVYLG